jgi:hypothetical protein
LFRVRVSNSWWPFVDIASGAQGAAALNRSLIYLISVWHDDSYETDFSAPGAQRLGAQVGAFNDELQQAGAWVFAAGLQPASSATVVRSAAGQVSMTDGPYAETKEQMGGFC